MKKGWIQLKIKANKQNIFLSVGKYGFSETERLPVRVRLQTMCRGELSVAIAWLM